MPGDQEARGRCRGTTPAARSWRSSSGARRWRRASGSAPVPGTASARMPRTSRRTTAKSGRSGSVVDRHPPRPARSGGRVALAASRRPMRLPVGWPVPGAVRHVHTSARPDCGRLVWCYREVTPSRAVESLSAGAPQADHRAISAAMRAICGCERLQDFEMTVVQVQPRGVGRTESGRAGRRPWRGWPSPSRGSGWRPRD